MGEVPVIRVFGHDNLGPCVCGKKDFLTITCHGGNKFLWQNPDGTDGSGNPPKINGIIYAGQIMSITVCVHCKVLQNFNF